MADRVEIRGGKTFVPIKRRAAPVRADDRTKQRLGQLQNSQRMKPVKSGFCELNTELRPSILAAFVVPSAKLVGNDHHGDGG